MPSDERDPHLETIKETVNEYKNDSLMSSKDVSDDNSQLNITNENNITHSGDSRNISKTSNKDEYTYNKVFQRSSSKLAKGRNDLNIPKPDRNEISLSPIRTSSAINSHRSNPSHKSNDNNDSIELNRDNLSARKINLNTNHSDHKDHKKRSSSHARHKNNVQIKKKDMDN